MIQAIPEHLRFIRLLRTFLFHLLAIDPPEAVIYKTRVASPPNGAFPEMLFLKSFFYARLLTA
jgi:hypothetical protein